MNQDAHSYSEFSRGISLPVGSVVEQLLFAAETIVRTSPFTDDDRDRIESALAAIGDALSKPTENPKQRDLSYGLFVPGDRPLTINESQAFADM